LDSLIDDIERTHSNRNTGRSIPKVAGRSTSLAAQTSLSMQRIPLRNNTKSFHIKTEMSGKRKDKSKGLEGDHLQRLVREQLEKDKDRKDKRFERLLNDVERSKYILREVKRTLNEFDFTKQV